MQTRIALVEEFNAQIDACVEQYIVPSVVLFGRAYRIFRAYCTDNDHYPFSIEIENPDVFGKEECMTVLCNVLGLTTQVYDMQRLLRREKTR